VRAGPQDPPAKQPGIPSGFLALFFKGFFEGPEPLLVGEPVRAGRRHPPARVLGVFERFDQRLYGLSIADLLQGPGCGASGLRPLVGQGADQGFDCFFPGPGQTPGRSPPLFELTLKKKRHQTPDPFVPAVPQFPCSRDPLARRPASHVIGIGVGIACGFQLLDPSHFLPLCRTRCDIPSLSRKNINICEEMLECTSAIHQSMA